MEQDMPCNEYSDAKATIKLPIFTKELLIGLTNIPTGDTPRRRTAGSCCFDLAWRLGLLPDQPNSGFAEYEQNIPITNVVMRGMCCCARISRHGFVHLVSRFFQSASVQETPGAGNTITINTTIGRFKCYDIDDRTFVHFDASLRSPPVAKLIMNQDMNDIVRAALGQFAILDPETPNWSVIHNDDIPTAATSGLFFSPNAIMYIPKEKIDTWNLMNKFARQVFTCAMQYIFTLQKPESFCRLIERVAFDPINGKCETPPEWLAWCFFMLRLMSTMNAVDMTPQREYSILPCCTFDASDHIADMAILSIQAILRAVPRCTSQRPPILPR